jgi:hypothetical protein
MITIERTCKELDPWELLTCPVCGDNGFISMDYASVWCRTCNAQFVIRYTAGDPGFVVDCHTEHVTRGQVTYALPDAMFKPTTLAERGWKIPKTDLLTAVVKVCEDPVNDAKDWHMIFKDRMVTWQGTPEQIAVVDPTSGK